MSELHKKPLTELRGIAQSFGIADIFSKDAIQLAQEISLCQQNLVPPVYAPPEPPPYDARLMTKPPSRRSSVQEIIELLEPFVVRGLHLSFDDERWYMQNGKRTDEGTLRMPLRIVLQCAEAIMKPGRNL